MENNNKITVLGSGNGDIFVSIDRIPEMGETISGHNLKYTCGGKGANQAVCIGKLGYKIDWVGQVGKDGAGQNLINEFKKNNVNTDYITEHVSEPTGTAFIFNFPNKDNSIVIVGGANMNWENNNLENLKLSLKSCKLYNLII